jgi:hypothetical protein
MNITNKKRFIYFAGLVFAISALFFCIWMSRLLYDFLINKGLSFWMVCAMIVIYFVAFGKVGAYVIKEAMRSLIKNKAQQNITCSNSVEINNLSYTLGMLRKNEILHEYDEDTFLERDSYENLWLHCVDTGLFKLLRNTSNRVTELWLLVDSISDSDYRWIYLNHQQRCRPPYIALDIKGSFWAVTE